MKWINTIQIMQYVEIYELISFLPQSLYTPLARKVIAVQWAIAVATGQLTNSDTLTDSIGNYVQNIDCDDIKGIPTVNKDEHKQCPQERLQYEHKRSTKSPYDP